ncbi:hypothetical protein EDD18DRAFT_1102026 [Armillaria luteobubalina]|uniref:Uncharacterized protein n=1 Tax=Armillaria luteobubalina TaxID=153913 RepID=A0AA39UWW3_9AGAR|nr:hypothetical protein EDD18DRAFT_1102026 [Armillaria luteobubalina]
MKAPQNIGFTAATGFGCNKEEYLTKNAVQFHLLESGEFSAFSEIWLESIWQQHVLYWPPEDHTDIGLKQHQKRVQEALRWLFDALDPDACKQQLVHATTHEPKIYPPGPPECTSTISSVKHGFVCLPVSPQKQKTTAAGNFHDLPEFNPGSDNVEDPNDYNPQDEYHFDPEAYALAMAGDVEDIATAPQRCIYTVGFFIFHAIYS